MEFLMSTNNGGDRLRIIHPFISAQRLHVARMVAKRAREIKTISGIPRGQQMSVDEQCDRRSERIGNASRLCPYPRRTSPSGDPRSSEKQGLRFRAAMPATRQNVTQLIRRLTHDHAVIAETTFIPAEVHWEASSRADSQSCWCRLFRPPIVRPLSSPILLIGTSLIVLWRGSRLLITRGSDHGGPGPPSLRVRRCSDRLIDEPACHARLLRQSHPASRWANAFVIARRLHRGRTWA